MYKYFDINDKWGKGFITHKDREHLHFVIIGKVARVISDKEEKIEKWKERVGVIEITGTEAEVDIKQYRLDGLINRKAQTEEELIDIQSKIDALKVV